MEFITKKPPIVQSSNSSSKRLYTLHVSIILVALSSVALRSFVAGNASNLDAAFKTFLMLVVGVLVSIIIEIFYSIAEGTVHKFSDYKAYVDPINTGLLIALLLPVVTPIYVLVLAVFVGVYVAKLVFGGYGYYIFNPVLVGVLFANLAFESQLIVSGTPLLELSKLFEGQTVEFTSITTLLVGNYQAIAIGSTSVIALIIVFFYLTVTKVIDLRISGTFLLSVLAISIGIGVINGYTFVHPWNYVLINMITGLTLFGATFLISESVSSPTSRETKMIYAVLVAVMMMIVRTLGTQVEGLVFAILLGNMVTPFINRTVKRSNKQTLIKTVLILTVVVALTAIFLGLLVKNNIESAIALEAFIGGVM